MYKVLHIPTGSYLYTDTENTAGGTVHTSVKVSKTGLWASIYLFSTDSENMPNALLIVDRFFLSEWFNDSSSKQPIAPKLRYLWLEYIAMDIKYFDNKELALNSSTPANLVLPIQSEFELEWYEGEYLDATTGEVKWSKKQRPKNCQ